MNNEKGFSLLEALVAITILGITLGIIMALFSGAMRSVGASEEYSKALLLARKEMEDTMLMEDIHLGAEDGSFGNGYTWKRTISSLKISEEDEYLNENLPFNLYEIEIKVKWWSWKVEKMMSLRSIILRETLEE
ncbi:MAG: prepilin-type N-terminal cleavage/methylation domain-containing protein [Nitrospinae bacterium]|nr:prepilin-type N-terminal cleavage/methylation domain-containing protein [Nitrospinota bacterium]